MRSPSPVSIALALLSTWLIWGSTYLAIRFGVEDIPPFMMASTRFLIAGGVMFAWLKWRGEPLPSRQQVRNAAIIGLMMLAGGNGAVTYAEQQISSGVAALGVAIVPLLTVLVARFWGHHSSRLEWLGILVGFAGIVMLNLGASLKASPAGAALLIFAAAIWAVASVWGKYLTLPKGLMSSAIQMLAAGVALALLSLACGEKLAAMPSWKAIGALAYLTVLGSMIAYSAFSFLLLHVRPALASSYAYVNPMVAVFLGWWLGGEHIGAAEIGAMLTILTAVAIVVLQQVRGKG